MTSAALDLRREPRHGVGVGADEMERRLAHLLVCGFEREAADKVFEAINLPVPEVIDLRLADLRALGFADPVKMVTSLPAILGLAIDNIRGKLADLRALGFADPVKMVTSSPAILGLAIDNIRGKLADLRALGFADPVKMVTSSPAILGYSRERLLLCGGIVGRLSDRDDGQLGRLINKRRVVIDAVAAARPDRWSDVLAIVRAARNGSKP